MTPYEKHQAAQEALKRHQIEHIKIQREYEASLDKLKTLDRAASDTWRELTDALQRR